MSSLTGPALPPRPAHIRTTAPDNETMFQAFEWYVPADHKHWTRLQNALPSLGFLGISSIWIPPACKAGWYTGNGYDIYDLFDLGEFEQKGSRHTKWGTKEELVALAKAAEKLRIKLLFDAVLNHKAAADRSETVLATKVNPEDRKVALGKPDEIEAWCVYDFPGRGSAHSPLRWNHIHFNGIDYCQRTKSRGVWKFHGKEWAQDVDEELGNYDYLMFGNIDHKNPQVRQDLFYWIQWLAYQMPLGGLRLDAIKHYSAGFVKDFLNHVRHTVGKDWFVVGEYWREDQDVLRKYIEYMDHGLSLFDVRLVSNFSRLSRNPNTDLRSVFDGSLVSIKPRNAVTPVAEYFVPLAYAMILLRLGCGLPCVFYGDLYGYAKPDGSGFVAPPYGSKILPRLMLARKLYAYGPQSDYFDAPHCVGFTRQGQPNDACDWKRAGLAVVMTNAREACTKTMIVGKAHAGEVWTDILHGCLGSVQIDDEGRATFGCAPRSVAVWVNSHAPRRDELEHLIFDCDIYRRGLAGRALNASDLYHPRLDTQPSWMKSII